MSAAPITIRQTLLWATRKLNHSSDAPHLDAQWLLLHVLGLPEAAWLYAHPEDVLAPEAEKHFRRLVAERATGKPLAYLLGWAEFYGRRFMVTEDVLIPRSSTEELVEAVLMYRKTQKRFLTVADIGTGSGCIAITLALELAQELKTQNLKLKIIATDISSNALSMARYNARYHGVFDQIEFLEGDVLEPLAGRSVDLIVSNPPYIRSGELAQAAFSTDTRGLLFEPLVALDGGNDGQRFVRQLLEQHIPALIETAGGAIRATVSNDIR
jgi:release factor glutamine methyltransferase